MLGVVPGREALQERWAVSIEKLDTGEISQYRAHDIFQSASVIKVFIMGAVYDRICYPADENTAIMFAESYDGELRNLLEQAFDEAQQQQLIQINQLESEVRDLRRLATDRSKNRKYILQERFRTLTGEDWPEDK